MLFTCKICCIKFIILFKNCIIFVNKKCSKALLFSFLKINSHRVLSIYIRNLLKKNFFLFGIVSNFPYICIYTYFILNIIFAIIWRRNKENFGNLVVLINRFGYINLKNIFIVAPLLVNIEKWQELSYFKWNIPYIIAFSAFIYRCDCFCITVPDSYLQMFLRY